MRLTRAVVLAAGRGKRLAPLTDTVPKPLLRIGDKPLLEHILTGLCQAGIQECLCVIGHLGQQIADYFGDGARVGLRMSYVWQKDAPGTGAALRLGRKLAQSGPVLMSFGDILTAYEHYTAILFDYHRSPCAAVMGINPMADVSSGAAVLRDGDRVTGIVEKPSSSEAASNWNQAGVTAFGAEIWPVLDRLPLSPRGEYEITAAVAMLIEQGLEVRAVEFRGFWSDVGTPEALSEASRQWPLVLRAYQTPGSRRET